MSVIRAFLVIQLLVHAAVVKAQTLEPITKPITLYVAGTAGGGIDLYARLLARRMASHIAGNPIVVVQDMPGAGGIRAAAFLANVAPKDGTALTMFPGGPLLEPLLGARNPGYDMSQFNWIGSMSRDVSVCISWSTSRFKTLQDVMDREMVLAGTGAGSETDTHPVALNAVLGTKFRVITGYQGSKETFLAMENGEVQGRCGLTYSALRAAKPDWLRDVKVNVLIQVARAKSAELPDVPVVMDLLSNPEDKQVFELLTLGTIVARPVALPPGAPKSRIETLRHAFDLTMKDPEFVADASKIQADIMRRAYETPRAVVERAKKYIAPINK
jgi:tripartite-type tricarboxylate transporter receptor subunit TctC